MKNNNKLLAVCMLLMPMHAWSMGWLPPEPEPEPDPVEIRGNIDGVNNGTISGWACEAGISTSIDIHVYGRDSAGNERIIGGYRANRSSEAAISTSCRTSGIPHRFNVQLTESQLQSFAGQSIHVYGISTTGVPNAAIGNSGTYSLPALPDPSVLSELPRDGAGNVTVPAGTSITIDSNFNGGYITVYGVLQCPQNSAANLNITSRGILVTGSGAEFRCGTSASPYGGQLNVTLTGAPGDGQNHKRGIMAMNGATVNLHAQTNGRAQRTRLNRNATPGTDTIVLAQGMSGWQVGDEILVAATGFNVNENERRTIVDINAARDTIRLNAPLSYYHHGQTEGFSNGQRSWTLDERAHVLNLERSITIASANDQYWSQSFGAHVMLMSGSRGYVQGVKFERVGQLGILGRYPFHWHRIGNANGQYVRDSVVVESKNRCYTIHGTNNATLNNNACYDHLGHGYFLEDGNETGNTISNNIGILSRRPPAGQELLFSDIDPGNTGMSIGRQRAVGPSTYWITHPTNTVVNNVSVASEGTGFWMSFPDSVSCSGNPACSGDVFGNIQPINAPTTAFNGNQASTNVIGFTWDGKINTNAPINNPRNPGNDFGITSMHYNNDPRVDGLVAYKSSETAVYFRGNGTMMRNVILADSIWQYFVANNQGLIDSLLVARSANNDWNDASNPLNTRVSSGVLLYDGPFDLQNTHFANFSPYQENSPINGADVTSEAISIIGGSSKYTNIIRGVTFNPEPARKVNMNYFPRVINWGDSAVTTMRDVSKSFDYYGAGDNRTLYKPADPINYLAGDCVTPARTVHTIRCNHGAATIKLGFANGARQDRDMDYRVIRQVNYDSATDVLYEAHPQSLHQTKFPIIMGRNQLNYVVDLLDVGDTSGFSLYFDAENRTDVSPMIKIRNTFPHCAVSNMAVSGLRQVSYAELENGADNAYTRMNDGIALRFRATEPFGFGGNSSTAGHSASTHRALFSCR